MKTMTTLLAGLVFSGLAHADVTLTIPDNVELLVVNQAKPDIDGGLFSSSKTVTLPDGENQIVMRYTPYFSQGNDRIIVDGAAIIAKFEAQDQQIEFQLPEYKNQRDAEKNIKQLQLKLTTSDGQPIAVAQDELIKNGLQLGRDYVRETGDYNVTGGIAAITVAGAYSAQAPISAVTAQAADSNTVEEMLHFWYQKADDETKAKFKQFINQ
ncbi:DUF2057 family protein [Vibrio renipiscarius]|uniref:DUF2057 family protein n=1 Tax=Vibrio renipiscarius TaxID=1461322 RepID=UPI00354E7FA5